MPNDYKKLFAHIESPELPENLFGKIMQRINQERRLSVLKRKLAVISFMTTCSLAAFIPVFRMAQAEFSQSGFFQFFSLIFSDFGTIITQWQSFIFTLLESLPLVSITALLAVIFVFLLSLKILTRNIQDIKVALIPKIR